MPETFLVSHSGFNGFYDPLRHGCTNNRSICWGSPIKLLCFCPCRIEDASHQGKRRGVEQVPVRWLIRVALFFIALSAKQLWLLSGCAVLRLNAFGCTAGGLTGIYEAE